MLNFINDIDSKLFLWLNSFHNPFFDQMMYWISEKYIWIPLYVVFIVLFFKYYKWKVLYILLFVAILIAISDQASVQLFKNIFKRLRPCHQPALEGLVHLINNHCGGKYGFVSTHATNHFAIAVFVSFLLKDKIKYLGCFLLIWASLIAYSRIYLGVHYPADVIGGAILGGVLGYLIGKIAIKVLRLRHY